MKKEKELPTKVKSKLCEWFGGIEFKVLYFWEAHSTYLIVVKSGKNLICIRIFELFNKYSLSVDYDTKLEG